MASMVQSSSFQATERKADFMFRVWIRLLKAQKRSMTVLSCAEMPKKYSGVAKTSISDSMTFFRISCMSSFCTHGPS